MPKTLTEMKNELRHDGEPVKPEVLATEHEVASRLGITTYSLRQAITSGRIVEDYRAGFGKIRLFKITQPRIEKILRAVQRNNL
jgi:hypothetical protein